MTYDPLAERYIDKILPKTRSISEGDLKRAGIPPELHDEANEIVAQHEQKFGVKPTIDQVVTEARRRRAAVLRRGI